MSRRSQLTGVVLLLLVVVVNQPAFMTGLARADDQVDAQEREIRKLLVIVKGKTFYDLRDADAKAAITRLQQQSERAAPALAEMLADGLRQRKTGWINVYRPLFLLEGMGEHAKVALNDVVKALDDQHPINIIASAQVLERIGAPARDALPSLQRVWELPNQKSSIKETTARAIKKIDPKVAEELGIK